MNSFTDNTAPENIEMKTSNEITEAKAKAPKAPNKYAIKNASDHWQLCKVGPVVTDPKNSRCGKPSLDPFKYYGSLEQAAKALQNELLCDATGESEIDTSAIIEAIRESQAIVVKAVKEHS